jgi:putative ABC transport system permease protein
MSTLLQDVRYALQSFSKSAAFTVAAILTLALGIGANTAIFSVVDAVMLRPLPYSHPERLVSVWSGRGGSRAELAGIRERSHLYQGVAAYRTNYGVTLADRGDPQRINAALSTSNLFGVLGVTPALGRSFIENEDTPGNDRVLILSHDLWTSKFGSDPKVIGRTVTVDGVARTVVGVMPADFRFPERTTQAWLPIVMDANPPASYWGWNGFGFVGRLKPGVSDTQAQTELRAITRQLRHANPVWDPGPSYGNDAAVISLQTSLAGNVRPTLLILLAAVAAILLIACANVANLLLARGAAQNKAFAIRSALGARRRRLIRQFLTETALLSIFGAAAGVAIAAAVTAPLARGLLAATLQLTDIGVDRRVLVFTIVVAMITAMFTGLVPAFRTSDPNLQALLNESARGASGGRGHRRISDMLVVVETALAVMLVIGAGLLIHSFWQLRRTDIGFASDRLTSARIDLARPNFATDDAKRAFYTDVVRRLSTQPGISSVAVTTSTPLGSHLGGPTAFRVRGQFEDVHRELPVANAQHSITPNYLHTIGIPLLRGRGFTDADRQGSPGVVIVNEALAKRFWPNVDPVGQQIGYPWDSPWLTVVGVARNVTEFQVGDADSTMAIYVPLLQLPPLSGFIVVKSGASQDVIAAEIRHAVTSVDASVPVSEVRTMDELVSDSVAKPRFTMLLLAAFAGLALLLGAIGIYGVINYAVVQRNREIGIRIALGARQHDVIRLVVGRGTLLASLGAGIGLVLSLAAMRGVASLLYGVNSADPLTFVSAPILLVAVAMLASYIPARRAASVDPVTVLNAE